MMFNVITNWYVNYCTNAATWCAAHPVVTAIGVIVDAVLVTGCAAVAVFYGYKIIEYLKASKTRV